MQRRASLAGSERSIARQIDAALGGELIELIGQGASGQVEALHAGLFSGSRQRGKAQAGGHGQGQSNRQGQRLGGVTQE